MIANTRQIASLNLEKTVVIIPGGILEQHGPYLPSFSDGYVNLDEARGLADDLSEQDWEVVLFPVIPLGSGGANEIGGKHVFAGTYAIRPAVVRAIFMDIATDLGEQGFRYVFVLHGHGSPAHNMALDQAGMYFKDTFGGEMHNLFGIWSVPPEDPAVLTDAALEEDGFSVHAGAVETSSILHVRPDLVADDVNTAPIVKGNNFAELIDIASEEQWTGYFGSPRQASKKIGAQMAAFRRKANFDLALTILNGEELTGVMQYSSMAYEHEEIGKVVQSSRAEHARRARQQADWIKQHGVEL